MRKNKNIHILILKLLLFDLQIQDFLPFLYIYCYYNYTAKHADDNMTYL